MGDGTDHPAYPAIPRVDDLPERPRRIILHWTAGEHGPTDLELDSYHFLVEHAHLESPDPEDDVVAVRRGVPVAENMGDVGDPTPVGDPNVDYAAHTRGWNSYSVGVAICGMRGAVDRRPGGTVDPGSSPITRQQVRLTFGFLWTACAVWGLDPSDPNDLTTHFEAEHLHGVDQYPAGEGSWRWDVTWIPGLDLPTREDYGYWIREQVASYEGGSSVAW